ncbi:M43 family zinc metalloprotease [Maribacter sp. 2304DJ31-5]|uniref:M43 family zinc metalloprotease n=1 Tax=Maribacter sp. 2304DJ31-5 TaxID=3386273 RepID=UPI0039BD77B8
MKLNYVYFAFFIIFFSLSTAFAQEPGKRCAFDEYKASIFSANPTLENILTQTESNFKTSKSTGLDPNRVVTIPVVVNILHRGELEGTGRNIENERVDEQIRILNEWYSNMNNKGVDSKIRFCLASQDVFGKKTTGIYRYNTLFDTYVPFDAQGNLTAHDFEIKKNVTGSFPFQQYLNIWVADVAEWDSNGTLYGYANFPAPSDNQINIRDGVVINHKSFGLTEDSYAGLGVTAVHEVGHWLGLFHTFQRTLIDDKGTANIQDDEYTLPCEEKSEECEIINDKVCDTEPVLSPASSQNLTDCKGIDCDGNETNAVQNVMDYNEDGCYKFFTAGQVERMRNMLHLHRSLIVNQTAPPVACVVPTEPNGDDTPAENCVPNNKEDDYGFRLRQGGLGFGSNLALDGNTLAVADNGYTISLFDIEEDCALERIALITKYDPELLNGLPFNQEITRIGTKLALSDDYLVFTGTTKTLNAITSTRKYFFAIYKRNESGQFLPWKIELSNEVKVLELRDNELLIIAGKTINNYVMENNSLLKTQEVEINLQGVPGSLPSDWIVYNGEYLALVFHSSVQLFRKTNGIWDPEPIDYVEGIFYSGGINLTESNELFITSNDDNKGKIRHYEIIGNNIISKSTEQVSDFGMGNVLGGTRRFLLRGVQTINENMLLVSRYGMGSTFHFLDNNEIDRIENIPYLQNSYIPSVLAPDSHSNDPFGSISFGQNDVIGDKFYVVSNAACSEIFIYNLNNILEGVSEYEVNLDKLICGSPPSSTLTSGRTITIGGTLPCSIDFNQNDGRKIFEATDAIRILPGTKINFGSNFSAKITTDENCNLNGGAYSKLPLSANQDAYASKLYIYDAAGLTAKIPDDSLEINNLLISPNPTKGVLGITAAADNLVISSAVIGLTGTKLLDFNNTYKNVSFELDLSDFPTGIFIVNFNMEDGSIISKKIIKE